MFGNPNKRNSHNETALHLACQLPLNASPSLHDKKVACIRLILQWKGIYSSLAGGIEIVDLKAQDMVNLGNVDYFSIVFDDYSDVSMLEWKHCASHSCSFGNETHC